MNSTLYKYFRGSFLITILGLGLGAFLGYEMGGTVSDALTAFFIVGVLCVLEISLSFDNAVVNATVLENMDEVWRRRFITWGIAIAVVGMRIVFPLAIVAIIAWISPLDALIMAATAPDEYADTIERAHVSVCAFGGAFLAMVGLKHFFDAEKEVHWVGVLERPLSRIGRLDMVEIAVVLVILCVTATQLTGEDKSTFLIAGVAGLVTYVAVDGIGAIFGGDESDTAKVAARTGFSGFLYLEVVDASFSFDGVIGAFAISNNLFIIAIGLGVGAMFVRSMTIMLVDKGTLTEYRYLEHGAFYAITALAVIMFVKTFVHVPEAITGLIGAGFIGASFWSSILFNRAEKQKAERQVA